MRRLVYRPGADLFGVSLCTPDHSEMSGEGVEGMRRAVPDDAHNHQHRDDDEYCPVGTPADAHYRTPSLCHTDQRAPLL